MRTLLLVTLYPTHTKAVPTLVEHSAALLRSDCGEALMVDCETKDMLLVLRVTKRIAGGSGFAWGEPGNSPGTIKDVPRTLIKGYLARTDGL